MIQLYESLAGIVNQLSTRLYNVKYVYIYIYIYIYILYIYCIYIYIFMCMFDVEACKTIFEKKKRKWSE